jgi:hypothetical protein
VVQTVDENVRGVSTDEDDLSTDRLFQNVFGERDEKRPEQVTCGCDVAKPSQATNDHESNEIVTLTVITCKCISFMYIMRY